MTSTMSLPAIAHSRDAKIRAWLAGDGRQQFWHARCPMEGTAEEQYSRLHALGFDNYPLASIPAVDALQPHLFFFERIFGAQVCSTDGAVGDFFRTWCHPLIMEPDDIDRLAINLDASPLWMAYEHALRGYLHQTPMEDRLPVLFPGLSPLDMACNLCGTEAYFVFLHEEPKAADRLLDIIITVQIEAYRRIKALGAHPVTGYGFPGVYCNDLQLPYLSPAHIIRFILPRYARLATECEGLLLTLLSADQGVLHAALQIEGLIGCAFDKSLPLADIKRQLGTRLFLIPNYVYDDTFDRPTLHDGIWCNPIVQSYSRELPAIYREFAEEHSLLISIERHSLAEVCAVRQALSSS